jgi:hypothetical protein
MTPVWRSQINDNRNMCELKNGCAGTSALQLSQENFCCPIAMEDLKRREFNLIKLTQGQAAMAGQLIPRPVVFLQHHIAAFPNGPLSYLFIL